MKINNLPYNINFEKIHVANCNVVNNKQPVECKIFELDSVEDSDYFNILSDDPNWNGARFLDAQCLGFKEWLAQPNLHHYVLEDYDSKCLGYALINKKDDSCLIDFIETAPKLKNDNSCESAGNYKYIGESLLSFIAKKMQKLGVKEIEATSISSVKDFYINRCGFQLVSKAKGFFLPLFKMALHDSNYDQLIKQNEEHTGASIDLVA